MSRVIEAFAWPSIRCTALYVRPHADGEAGCGVPQIVRSDGRVRVVGAWHPRVHRPPLGKMAALRVQDFDMLRRRVNVSRSVTESGGLQWSTPKSWERRSLPFPAALAEQLAALMIGKDVMIWSSPTSVAVCCETPLAGACFRPAVESAVASCVSAVASRRSPAKLWDSSIKGSILSDVAYSLDTSSRGTFRSERKPPRRWLSGYLARRARRPILRLS
jgi:hypothetical protein